MKQRTKDILYIVGIASQLRFAYIRFNKAKFAEFMKLPLRGKLIYFFTGR